VRKKSVARCGKRSRGKRKINAYTRGGVQKGEEELKACELGKGTKIERKKASLRTTDSWPSRKGGRAKKKRGGGTRAGPAEGVGAKGCFERKEKSLESRQQPLKDRIVSILPSWLRQRKEPRPPPGKRGQAHAIKNQRGKALLGKTNLGISKPKKCRGSSFRGSAVYASKARGGKGGENVVEGGVKEGELHPREEREVLLIRPRLFKNNHSII